MRIALGKFVQNFYLNIGVVDIKFFVFAQFCCDDPLVGVLVVKALDNLAECALINDADNLIAIGYLLSDFCKVLTIFISYHVLVMTANFADGEDAIIHLYFHFFKLSKLLAKELESLLNSVAIKT